MITVLCLWFDRRYHSWLVCWSFHLGNRLSSLVQVVWRGGTYVHVTHAQRPSFYGADDVWLGPGMMMEIPANSWPLGVISTLPSAWKATTHRSDTPRWAQMHVVIIDGLIATVRTASMPPDEECRIAVWCVEETQRGGLLTSTWHNSGCPAKNCCHTVGRESETSLMSQLASRWTS